MKKYIKGSTQSGSVGIWWLIEGKVISGLVSLDSGFNNGSYIQYSETKNHLTEWSRLVKDNFPDSYQSIIKQGYKAFDRGRVIYNLRTMTYEVTCGQEVFDDIDKRRMIVDAFDLNGCRYDFVNLPTHYHRAVITGNPSIDQFEYGI